jgi:hypothetical protein
MLPSAKGLSIYFSCWVNLLFQLQLCSTCQASYDGERSKHIYSIKYILSWIIIADNYIYDK